MYSWSTCTWKKIEEMAGIALALWHCREIEVQGRGAQGSSSLADQSPERFKLNVVLYAASLDWTLRSWSHPLYIYSLYSKTSGVLIFRRPESWKGSNSMLYCTQHHWIGLYAAGRTLYLSILFLLKPQGFISLADQNPEKVQIQCCTVRSIVGLDSTQLVAPLIYIFSFF